MKRLFNWIAGDDHLDRGWNIGSVILVALLLTVWTGRRLWPLARQWETTFITSSADAAARALIHGQTQTVRPDMKVPESQPAHDSRAELAEAIREAKEPPNTFNVPETIVSETNSSSLSRYWTNAIGTNVVYTTVLTNGYIGATNFNAGFGSNNSAVMWVTNCVADSNGMNGFYVNAGTTNVFIVTYAK
jgi:hypothetical protein